MSCITSPRILSSTSGLQGGVRTLFLASFLFLLATTCNAATFIVTKTADTNDNVCNADCSLREAISAANASTEADIIDFDSTVFNTPQTITLASGQLVVLRTGGLSLNGPGADLLTISGNNASRIIWNEGEIATVSGLTLTNGSSGDGGAVFSGFLASLTLDGVNIRNSAGGQAAAVYSNGADGSSITLRNCKVQGNGSSSTSAIIFSNGPLTIENTDVSGNVFGSSSGYAVVVSGSAPANVVRSSIRNNAGGGISVSGNAALVLDSSTVSGNKSSFAGGGVLVTNQGLANIHNSTISGNSTPGWGGGIYCLPGTTVNLLNSTVSANLSDSEQNGTGHGGGIYNGFGGTVNAKNTIVAGNFDNTGLAPDFGGTLSSQGYNLIGNALGLVVNGDTGGNKLNVDARLFPLGEFGGATATHSLQPGSPAIDAGSPSGFLPVDQRGITRPRDGDHNGTSLPDIGSVEVNVVTFTVTKTTDSNDGVCDGDCSLREAINAANGTTGESTVDFSPAVFGSPQTIVLSFGEIPIYGSGVISVSGPGSDLVTISGGNGNRIFYILSSAVTVRNVKIVNGNGVGLNSGSGGAIYNEAGTLSLSDAIVTTNSASSSGGAIYNAGGIVTITDSQITNNAAAMSGGGVGNLGGSTLHVINSTFSGNSAQLGGGIHSVGTTTVVGSTFRLNSAASGAGIQNLNPGTLDVRTSSILNNTATVEGGGINSAGSLALTSTTISANSAGSGRGGGISSQAFAELELTSVSNNTANFGGGIFSSAELQMHFSTISGNNAGNRGGGLESTGLFVIRQSSLYNNTAAQSGGAISSFATMAVYSSTVSGNSAGASGGGIFNDAPTAFSNLVYSTIVNNHAPVGGGVKNVTRNLAVRDTILANNTATSSAPNYEGVLSSQGHNLIEDTSGITITGSTTGNILGVDPMLGPLKNNGGPTLTHGLFQNSPAVDTSHLEAQGGQDQRGFSTPVDGNGDGFTRGDIGAFERYLTDRVALAPFDFDGDSKTDIGIFRPAGAASEWWINRSSTGQTFALQFGASTDKITPADYTGDGKADIAFFRPSSGEWYVLRSEDFSFFALPFGSNGDVPVPADYDADGKADFAVFRPSNSTWFISQSSGAPARIVQFGATADQPVVADYDADGKADIGIFRPAAGGAEWWIQRSTAGLLALQFGASTDKAVQGDYTGDGKADVAVWKPSTGEWFIVRSEDSSFYGFPFGASTDIPAPGDYDGDGKFDATVFRPSNATWFIGRTTAGTQIVQFGATGDRPIPNAFVP